jgi:hypothetical protein
MFPTAVQTVGEAHDTLTSAAPGLLGVSCIDHVLPL